MGREESNWKSTCIIIVITFLITPLLGFGATQNVTEQDQNITLSIPEKTSIPENVTSGENVTEFNEAQPENSTITEQIITILSQPENVTVIREPIITILSEPEDIANITAPIITIRSPENTTYNTTSIELNYTINKPTDWVGYSLNGADKVTITGNSTFTAPVGVNHLVVYARDTAGNSGKAEVHFNVTGTDSLGITPKLSAKKDFFSLDEEPAFTFEYKTFNKSFTVVPQKAVKKWTTANEAIETFVYDSSGALTDIEPEIEKISDGKFSITVPRARAFRAGVYELSVKLVKDGRVYVVNKEFPWGLVSLNTRKSIYKPGEIAEFIIVVLDKEGHSVCNAAISMTVTNPDNEKTTYSTTDGTITAGTECGLYHANYPTEVEGNHTIDVIALIDDVEVSFETYFSVQQNYAFDIIRTAQSKIDPTRQNWFEVTIDIESFTDTSSLTLKEFVPAAFDISADAATVLVDEDTKTIIWNKDLIENKASVCYSYAVPHIWPYLYALGPVEIEYNGKTFTEARPWYVAVDPYTLILRPNGPGSYTQWTKVGAAPTNWESVDDITPDDDATYVKNYTLGSKDLYNLTDSGLAGVTINSVTVWMRMIKMGGNPSTATLIRTHNTDYEYGTSISPSPKWVDYSTTYTYNPNTTTNWTVAEVDALATGVVQKSTTASGQETAVTQVWVVVDYTDITPPKWYNQSQNVSKLHKGEAINLSARWTDNKGLKNATLAHNGTGTWQNVSTIALSGTENWSNFTLVTGLGWTPGIKGWKIYANDTSNNTNVTDVMTFELWGWSNVTWNSPPDGSSNIVGSIITLTCLVRDANTSSSIQNYPVHFYNRTDSTVTYDFGISYTNSSGYAVMDWDTTGVAAVSYYPKGNITDNATLFYNVSAVHEANTSIKLLSPTLEIRNQTASQGITSINLSGTTGDTILDPHNDVDGSGSAQNPSTTTPVVTIYNPASSTSYKIWLKVEEGSEWWDYIVKDEKFNITTDATDPGDVSTWTSLKAGESWGELVDTGETVTQGTYKDLYLAFLLKGSGIGNATISVLGEVG